MDVKNFIDNWIETSNAFETEKYLNFYLEDAVLDDVSVGRKFDGHNGIKKYFESYFIGYNTQTKVMQLEISNDNKALLEVNFTGDFPEGKIGGTFELQFKNNKIAFIKADLI